MSTPSSSSSPSHLSTTADGDESSLAYTALLHYRRESLLDDTSSRVSELSTTRRSRIQTELDELVAESAQDLRSIRNTSDEAAVASPEEILAFQRLQHQKILDENENERLRQQQQHAEEEAVEEEGKRRKESEIQDASLADILAGRFAADDHRRRDFPKVEHKERRHLSHHPEAAAAHRQKMVEAELSRREHLVEAMGQRMEAAARQRQILRKKWEDDRRGFGDRTESWMTKILLAVHLQNANWDATLRYLRARQILQNLFLPIAKCYIRRKRKEQLLQDFLSGRLSGSAPTIRLPLPRPTVDSLTHASPIIARWPQELAEQLVREMHPVAMLNGSMPLVRREDPLRCTTAFFFLARGRVLVGEDLVLKASSNAGRSGILGSAAAAAGGSSSLSASTQAAAAVITAQAIQQARATGGGAADQSSSSALGVAGFVSSLCTVRAGEFFGDVAVVCGDPAAAPVRCTTDCVLYSISGDRFVHLMSQSTRTLKASVAACKLLLRLQLSAQRKIEVEELKDVDPVFQSMPNGAVQQIIHKSFPVVLFKNEVLTRDAHSSPCVYFVEMGRLTGKVHYNTSAEHNYFSSVAALAASKTGKKNSSSSSSSTTNTTISSNKDALVQKEQMLHQKHVIAKRLFQAQLKTLPVVEWLPGSVLCMSSFCRYELFDVDPAFEEHQDAAAAAAAAAARGGADHFYDPATRNTITARAFTICWAFPITHMTKILGGNITNSSSSAAPFKGAEPRIVETAVGLIFDAAMDRAGLALHAVPAFGVQRGLLRPKHMFMLQQLFHPVVAVAGTVLCKSGGDPVEVFVVLEGTVKWQRRRFYETTDEITGNAKNVFETTELGTGGPGTVVGLAECLVAKNFSMWCCCESSVVLLRAKVSELRALFENGMSEEAAWAIVFNVMTEEEKAATRKRQKEMEHRRQVTMSVLPVEPRQQQQQQHNLHQDGDNTDKSGGGKNDDDTFIAPPGTGVDVKAARALCRDRIVREIGVARAEQARRDELKKKRPLSPHSQWLASALEARRIEARRVAVEQRVVASVQSRVFGDQVSNQDSFIMRYFDPASEENLRAFSSSLFVQDETTEALRLSLAATKLVETNKMDQHQQQAEMIRAKRASMTAATAAANARALLSDRAPLPRVHVKDMLAPAKEAAEQAAIMNRRRQQEEGEEKLEMPLSSSTEQQQQQQQRVRERKVQIAREKADEDLDQQVDRKVQEVLKQKQKQQQQQQITVASSSSPSLCRPSTNNVVVPPLDSAATATSGTSDAGPTRTERDLSFATTIETRHLDELGDSSSTLAAKAAMRERRLKKQSRQQFASAENFSRIRREADVVGEEKRVAPEELNQLAVEMLINNCPALSRKQNQEQQRQLQAPKPPSTNAALPATSRVGASRSSGAVKPAEGDIARTARLPPVPSFSNTKRDAAQRVAIRKQEKTRTDDLLFALLNKKVLS